MRKFWDEYTIIYFVFLGLINLFIFTFIGMAIYNTHFRNLPITYQKVYRCDVYVSDINCKDITIYKNVVYTSMSERPLKRNRIVKFIYTDDQKKLQSYSEYRRSNNITEKKQRVIIETTKVQPNPMFR